MPQFDFNRMQERLRLVERRLDALDRYAPSGSALDTFAAVLTGSVSDPTVAASAITFRYVRTNDQFVAWFSIVLDAGYVNGSGSMFLSLPFPLKVLRSDAANHYGTWIGGDANVPTNKEGHVMGVSGGDTTARVGFRFIDHGATSTGTLTTVSYTVPWTWAVGDSIRGEIIGVVADGY